MSGRKDPRDAQVDEAIVRTAVGGQPRIDLRYLGKIVDCDIFVDLAGKHDKDETFKLITAVMFRAFIGHSVRSGEYRVREKCDECPYDMGEQVIKAENTQAAIQQYVINVRSDKKKEKLWFKHNPHHNMIYSCEAA